MIVRTHMTPHPVTLRMDGDARAALQTMQEHSIHHLPVVGSDERLAGIVTERDLLLAALRSPGAGVEIGDVMHRDVISIRDDMPMTHAATLMVKQTIGGLPVVDAKGRLVGIITETDLLQAFVGVLEARMPRPGDATLRSSAGPEDRDGAGAPQVKTGRGTSMPRATEVLPATAGKTNGKTARRP